MTRRDRKRAERLVDRAVVALCDAARLLSDGGYRQPSRMLNNAAFEAATAISLAALPNDAEGGDPAGELGPGNTSND